MIASGIGFDPDLSRTDAQRLLTQIFAAAKIETPALDARLLLCASLGIGHLDLLREPDRQIGATAGEIEAAALRRLAGEPVARIIGRREFYGLDFALTLAVLDPRPDTEILVDAALVALEARRAEPLRLLDLGVGSGAILAALLSQLPAAFGVGVDRSEPACRVARNNLAALGFAGRSAVVCADWTNSLRGAFDAIVSNPPYIATGEIAGLAAEVRAHDPRGALDGGADGLAAYRILAAAVPQLLRPGGIVAFEVGATQAESVADLLGATGMLEPRDFLRDLGGHVRVVTAVRLVR
ncbi:MAG: peptide chain release factor N(5)-glutamine methyltransferase [Methylovirgula sp.]|uniref:peptide chain release factor N(5)-glutamine methyltransferase n=1 Tax=Methylovirgula sp. TaxID=1978224 RepID=UPI00307646B6